MALSKKAQEEIRDLTDKQFEHEWTRAAKELDEARERCKFFAEVNREREAKKKIEDMDPAERDALAQYCSANGFDASGPVNGDDRG